MMNETVVTIDHNRGPQQPPVGPTGAATQPPPATAHRPPTATTTPAGGGALGWIQFNYMYFLNQIPGYLKIAQLILGILCMALASPALLGSTHWFLFVVVTSFIITLLWSFVYLLGVREVLNLAVNWILTELVNTGVMTLLYFIAFIVQLAAWSDIPFNTHFRGTNIAAGVFGLFNTLVYAAGTYFLYLEYRRDLASR